MDHVSFLDENDGDPARQLGRDFHLFRFEAPLACAMPGGSAFSCCCHQYQAPAPPSAKMQASTSNHTGGRRFLAGLGIAGALGAALSAGGCGRRSRLAEDVSVVDIDSSPALS